VRGPTSEVLVNFVDRKQEKTIEKGQGANLVGCRLAVEPQPTWLAHHPVCSQPSWHRVLFIIMEFSCGKKINDRT
jgi:hypothetical protein